LTQHFAPRAGVRSTNRRADAAARRRVGRRAAPKRGLGVDRLRPSSRAKRRNPAMAAIAIPVGGARKV